MLMFWRVVAMEFYGGCCRKEAQEAQNKTSFEPEMSCSTAENAARQAATKRPRASSAALRRLAGCEDSLPLNHGGTKAQRGGMFPF